MKIQYVVGFLFSEDKKQVVLILKNRPAWQAGLYNGVGGKIEKGESPETAISREFQEEAGVLIYPSEWCRKVHLFKRDIYSVDILYAFSHKIGQVTTQTDEPIRVFDLKNIRSSNNPEKWLVKSLTWLLPLCLDFDIAPFVVEDWGRN